MQQATILAKLRAAIIVLVVGLLLTLAAVFGVDAFRRAATRRRAAVQGEPEEHAVDQRLNGTGSADAAPAGEVRELGREPEPEPEPQPVGTTADETRNSHATDVPRARKASPRSSTNGTPTRGGVDQPARAQTSRERLSEQ